MPSPTVPSTEVKASLYTGTVPETSDDEEDEVAVTPRQRFDRRLLHQQSKFTIWGSDASSASGRTRDFDDSSTDSDDDAAFLAEAALEAVRLREEAAARAVAAFQGAGGKTRKLVKLATKAVRTTGNPFQRAHKLKELNDREMRDKLKSFAQRFVPEGEELPPIDMQKHVSFVRDCRNLESMSTLQRGKTRRVGA